MRKQIDTPPTLSATTPTWLDLDLLAHLEFTSEEERHPIEAAFTPNKNEGWRAGQPGKQIIRLVFAEPRPIKRIKLVFEELEQARTQEFLLSWLAADEINFREIVRQQFNLTPATTSQQVEDYTVDLHAVKAVELTIIPDIHNPEAYAALTHFQLGE